VVRLGQAQQHVRIDEDAHWIRKLAVDRLAAVVFDHRIADCGIAQESKPAIIVRSWLPFPVFLEPGTSERDHLGDRCLAACKPGFMIGQP
jgi:hypothetical protein